MRRRIIAALVVMVGLVLPVTINLTAAEAAPAAAPVVPPNLTAEQWAAKFPATAKAANANAGLARAGSAQAMLGHDPVYTAVVATGPEPWGGHLWTGFDGATPKVSCSAGVNSMTSVGTRYVYDAGHCFKTAGNAGNNLDPATSSYQLTLDGTPIGNTGFGTANFNNAVGDSGWIRANQAGLTFSDLAVWDSRGAVNAACACDPVVGTTSVSISAGKSETLIRSGLITQVNKTSNFGPPNTAVPNQAEVRFNFSQSGCVQAGDSGSPVIGPNHEFLGVVSGVLVTGGWCFVSFDQGRKSLQRVAQTLAPSDPTA
jgi:hypothetical protein